MTRHHFISAIPEIYRPAGSIGSTQAGSSWAGRLTRVLTA